jgi:hypothetical protein
MSQPPKWYLPVTIIALLYNLAGLAFYLLGTMGPRLGHRPEPPLYDKILNLLTWPDLLYTITILGGVLGCLGLVLRKSWAQWMLLASLPGIIFHVIGLLAYGVARKTSSMMQLLAILNDLFLPSVILIIAIAPVWLGNMARRKGWLR